MTVMAKSDVSSGDMGRGCLLMKHVSNYYLGRWNMLWFNEAAQRF